MAAQGEWFAAPETSDFWRAAGQLDVTVCLQMRLGAATAQLRSVLERFPSVKVLLDHMGYPDIAASPGEAGRQVAELAQYPGLHLKLTHRSLEPLRDAGPEAVCVPRSRRRGLRCGADRLGFELSRRRAAADRARRPGGERSRGAARQRTGADLTGTARRLYRALGEEPAA